MRVTRKMKGVKCEVEGLFVPRRKCGVNQRQMRPRVKAMSGNREAGGESKKQAGIDNNNGIKERGENVKRSRNRHINKDDHRLAYVEPATVANQMLHCATDKARAMLRN